VWATHHSEHHAPSSAQVRVRRRSCCVTCCVTLYRTRNLIAIWQCAIIAYAKISYKTFQNVHNILTGTGVSQAVVPVFTARCYASAVLAMGLCPCLCPCLSQAGFLLKRQNVESHKPHHAIHRGHSFSDAKDLREIRPGLSPTGAPDAGGVGQNR